MAVSDVEKPVCDPSGWLSTSLHFKGKYEGRSGIRASCFLALWRVACPNTSLGWHEETHNSAASDLKNPPLLIATNLDSSANFKEALERLLDYTEKGKMLKERLLTQR